MKGMDFKPGGGFKQDDWISYYRQPYWKKPKQEGVKKNNLFRIGAALLVFAVFLALRWTGNPWGTEARDNLKNVLTTEWNYRPALERLAQAGQQVVEMDWSFFGNSTPAITKPQKNSAAGALPLPVSGKVIRGFGMVVDPVDNMERFHSGIDIAAPVGSAVRAVQDGKVKRVSDSPALGKYVLVEHDQPGSFTLYGGLSRATVGEGREVKAGQAVGEAGATGDITGDGLHFEVRENNKLVDPVPRLQINPAEK